MGNERYCEDARELPNKENGGDEMTEHRKDRTHANEPYARRGLADDRDAQQMRQDGTTPSRDQAGDKPKVYVGVLRELDELKGTD
jgi:hypothetical protein